MEDLSLRELLSDVRVKIKTTSRDLLDLKTRLSSQGCGSHVESFNKAFSYFNDALGCFDLGQQAALMELASNFVGEEKS